MRLRRPRHLLFEGVLDFLARVFEVGLRLVAPALNFGSPVAQGGQSVSQAYRPRPGVYTGPRGIQAIARCTCTASLALIGPPVHTGQRGGDRRGG